MNVSIKNKFECCGTTACKNICLHNAIKIKADSIGFKYPVVDEKRKDCGIYHDNLYLVDIICHRLPSPRFWSDYV